MTTATTLEQHERLPLYAVVDWTSEGKLRLLAEYVEPVPAKRHASMLNWAGSAAHVVLISAVRPEAVDA